MVTVGKSAKEVKDSGSRILHRMEAGLLAAYDWLSGPAMSDLERTQHKLAESEYIRRSAGSGF